MTGAKGGKRTKSKTARPTGGKPSKAERPQKTQDAAPPAAADRTKPDPAPRAKRDDRTQPAPGKTSWRKPPPSRDDAKGADAGSRSQKPRRDDNTKAGGNARGEPRRDDKSKAGGNARGETRRDDAAKPKAPKAAWRQARPPAAPGKPADDRGPRLGDRSPPKTTGDAGRKPQAAPPRGAPPRRPSDARPTGRPPIGPGRAPMAPKLPPPAGRPLRLPAAVYQAWRSTIIDHARYPRGAKAKEYTPDELLLALTRQEAGAVADLWEVFTQDRSELSRGLLGGKREAVAYLLGFHLPNVARAQLLLTRAAARHPLREVLGAGPLTWHDLGAGTGAAAQAVAAFALHAGVPQAQLAMHLYDGTGPLLDAARTLFAHAGLSAQVTTHRVGLESLDLRRLRPAGDGITGYSLGYVWNELVRNPVARGRLEQLFEAAVAGETLLAILEPATQTLCRQAMELRDRLVALGYVPLYPCPAAAACPMLELTRDWCYSEGSWERPASVEALDGFMRIDRSRISGTMLLFAAPSLARRLQAPGPIPPVVVGRPQHLPPAPPSAFDYLVCRGETLEKVAPLPGKNFLLRGMPLSD